MMKFISKVTLFIVFAAVIDVLCGWGFDKLRNYARGGQTYKNEYVSKYCKDDIIILGSSKADHHYVPSVIQDSLGLSCYNAGEMGCGIVPAYIRYKQIERHHKPIMVIYEVTPKYDYLEDGGYSNYLGTVRQYTYDKVVREVYLDFSDKLEGLRLVSGMYRNNSKLVTNIKDIIRPAQHDNGYEPLYGKMSPMQSNVLSNNSPRSHGDSVDSLKLKYVEKLIQETNIDGVKLVFMVSPTFVKGELSQDYAEVIKLCEQYSVPFVNNIILDGISGNSELFQDGTHLNHKGAVAYSRVIVPQLRINIGY